MKAEMLKQQEEIEATVFKKFFHSKIKKMSCIKKLKYIILILLFAGIVQSYFLFAYYLVQKINSLIFSSLGYYETIADRDLLVSSLIVFFRESVARNETIMINNTFTESNFASEIHGNFETITKNETNSIQAFI